MPYRCNLLLALAGSMLAGLTSAGTAQAHTGARAHILLLPTDLYLTGGVLVVAVSFLLMALVLAAGLARIEGLRWRLGRLPEDLGIAPSLASLALLAALVFAGYGGSRDPLDNPLPLTVWSLWWVGFTFCTVLFGNLWAVLNPWRGLYWLVTALPPLKRWRARPPLAYPGRLAAWPAVLLLLAFAWFELVYPAPQDPAVLADAVLLYAGVTLAGMLLFGETAWLQHGEAFSLFFRVVSWLSPCYRERDQGAEHSSLWITLPGLKLLRLPTLSPSGVAFVLLALSAVSFDGLSWTFWWLDLAGFNPLEYPGRTDLMPANSLGLLGLFAVLAAAYVGAVLLGAALAGDQANRESIGRFVISIVPIAFGYHFAHYLPEFLVEAQYALRALADPFALGWNLLGGRDLHVTASLLSDHRSVEQIWKIQVAAIVAAHVAAVAVAHLLALRQSGSLRQVLLSQAPLTLLMISYTLFGLWLLASPVAG